MFIGYSLLNSFKKKHSKAIRCAWLGHVYGQFVNIACILINLANYLQGEVILSLLIKSSVMTTCYRSVETNTILKKFWSRLMRAIVFTLVVWLGIQGDASSSLMAQSCTNTVEGIIFRDYNGDGLKGMYEPGVSGVTVRAYNSSNVQYGPVTSNASGIFALSIPNGTQIRLEYSGLPSGNASAPNGTDSRTTVRFVQSPICSAHLGINLPDEYCQNNPPIAVPCYVSGDPMLSGSNVANADVLVSVGYNSEGTTPYPNHIAVGSEMGSVWGVAYNKKTKRLFSTAFLKRHSGLGSLGLGGIYVTNLSGAMPVNSNFINLQTLGVNVGTISPRNLPANSNAPSRDAEAFTLIGKAGLGDIDITDDGNRLYVVNLAQKQLVAINITNYNATGALPTAANITTWTIPNPGCTNSNNRPFGLKWHNGRLYVGVVCSAETSKNPNDLLATVYEFNPSSGSFTSVLNFPLNYIKGTLTSFPTSISNNCNRWEPWSDTYTDFYHHTLTDGVCFPQPILSDIEFDINNEMVLGFMDRAGHQLGRANYSPLPADMVLHSGVGGGDLLRAAKTGATWQVENNGTSGGVTGCGAGSGAGIGGGEFYCGDIGAGGEQEASMGALALLKGVGQVVVAMLNPFTTHTGGIFWFSNLTGNTDKKYQVYGSDMLTMGKAHGLGDLELLCNMAPIEIGNYVWRDYDGDGVQDPGEPGLAGVTVNLYTASGTLVATTTTNANGEYYFNSSNVTGGLAESTNYVVALSAAQYASGVGLTIGSTFYGPISPANTGFGTNADMNDSDAVVNMSSGISAISSAGLPYIAFTTGTAGQNNHTLDFGLNGNTGALCPDYLVTVTPQPASAICSGYPLTLNVQHLAGVGNIRVLLNTGSILTPQELYSAGSGGATVLAANVTTVPGSTQTTVSISLPANNTTFPYPYNVYVILAPSNPNILNPICLPVEVVTMLVYPNPNATCTPNQAICAGQSVTLTANGGGTYLWSTGQTSANIIVNPATSTTYSVTVTNSFGCQMMLQTTVSVNTATANDGPDKNI